MYHLFWWQYLTLLPQPKILVFLYFFVFKGNFLISWKLKIEPFFSKVYEIKNFWIKDYRINFGLGTNFSKNISFNKNFTKNSFHVKFEIFT